jgi:cyanophycinase-like exopeptidase
MLGLGADPDDAVRFDDLGEAGVLGEEAVAGVDRVGVVISAAEMMLGMFK